MEKIVFTGGGTAGHVYPALAVKEEMGEDFEFHYIGSEGMEKEIVTKDKSIIYHQINAVKLQRKLTPQNLLIPFKLFSSIRQAKKVLKEIKPNVVFSKGGFVALPVVIASWQLKIPVVSHESDLSMGLANKIILRFCDKMCTAFEKTAEQNKKCIYTGQPIRKEILHGDKTKFEDYKKLERSLPNLLIVGGSSGAGFLNKITRENLDYLCEKFNVLHITGKGKTTKINHKNYFQIEYCNHFGDILALADFVISRAGSGAINEFLATSKPMFLIPLSKACSRGDQIENAKLFEKLGYAVLMEEENYNKEKFIEILDNLIKNNKILIKNMKKSAKINSCTNIVKIINDIKLSSAK